MPKTDLSPCGIDCCACPSYLAWKNDDHLLRLRRVAEWKAAFGFDGLPAEVDCVGCRVRTGPKISHCASCPIPACAEGKKLESCADCGDYGTCPDLGRIHSYHAEAKAKLDEIRNYRT